MGGVDSQLRQAFFSGPEGRGGGNASGTMGRDKRVKAERGLAGGQWGAKGLFFSKFFVVSLVILCDPATCVWVGGYLQAKTLQVPSAAILNATGRKRAFQDRDGGGREGRRRRRGRGGGQGVGWSAGDFCGLF